MPRPNTRLPKREPLRAARSKVTTRITEASSCHWRLAGVGPRVTTTIDRLVNGMIGPNGQRNRLPALNRANDQRVLYASDVVATRIQCGPDCSYPRRDALIRQPIILT